MPIKSSVLLLSALAACTISNSTHGPANTDRPSHAEASRAFAAASSQLAQAGHALSPHVANVTGAIDITSPCAVGGDLKLAGSYATGPGFDITASFDACAENEGALDGSLHWTETESSTQITDTWNGTLDWTDASGTWSCVFDYTSITHLGTGGVQLTGSICGYDVTADLGL